MNLTHNRRKPASVKPISTRLRVAATAILIAGWSLESGSVRAGVYPDTPTRLWPKGIIPFQYDNDPSINSNQRCIVQAAMSNWMAAANVSFVPRTTEPDFLFIRQWTTGPNYQSPEGYSPGTNILNLNFWGTNNNACSSCTRVFGIAHEIGHVLGLLHTHQSKSRDNYFNVRTNLIISGFQGNFTIDSNSLQWPRAEPDIDSIMSYPLCTFSICDINCPASDPDCVCSTNIQNCAPILLREPYATEWGTNLICAGQCPPPVKCIGQRNHLSVWDKAIMSYLYPQPNWRFAEAASTERQEDGRFHYPARTFGKGEELVPSGGTLFMEPSTYTNAGGLHAKAMTIRATQVGRVIIRE